MISGLQVDFTTDELRAHLAQRRDYHVQKAEFYATQVEQLSSGGVQASYASNDPVRSLQGSEKEHRDKAAFFSVLADHLVPNETYRLSEQDLVRVEVYSRYY